MSTAAAAKFRPLAQHGDILSPVAPGHPHHQPINGAYSPAGGRGPSASPTGASPLWTAGYVLWIAIGIIILVLVSLLWANHWGPIPQPVESDVCDDMNPCTANWYVNGVCQNPRMPMGASCSHCQCFTDTETTVCNEHGQCMGQTCAGTCAEDEDCPTITFIGEAAEPGNNYTNCHRNGSACQYNVLLDAPLPWAELLWNECPGLPWAEDLCWATISPTDPLRSCLRLSTTCTEIPPIFGYATVHCHWHFWCTKWNPEVRPYLP